MKSILLFLTFFLLGLSCQAQITSSDFVTIWKTDNAREEGSGPRQIRIPAWGQYTIYYENISGTRTGTLPKTGFFTDAQLITLPAIDTYRIAIRPAGEIPFHRIQFEYYIDYTDAGKLLEIEQWGTTVWSSMDGAFKGCQNLTGISATDVPDLSQLTSLSWALSACPSLVRIDGINDWDVSNVTDMSHLFAFSNSFNFPLDKWDVGKVNNMSSMFERAEAFNQSIDKWDVSNVTDMSSMFFDAISFNQPLENWDVSRVTSMHQMFARAYAFNQPLGKWTIKSLNSVNLMLYDCAMNCENFSKTLIGWANNQGTPDGIYFYTTRIYGIAAQSAYNYLTLTKKWNIEAVLDPSCTFSLPVHLISFTAAVTSPERSVHLQWSTSWEDDNKGFDIERSIDAVQWSKIGTINSLSENGASSAVQHYSFDDTAPLNGRSYYRLRQVDYSGKFQYSRIRSILFGAENVLTAFPNPASDMVTLTNLSKNGKVKVYSLSGQLLKIDSVTNNTQQISLGIYPTGIYNVVITSDQRTIQTVKVIKK